MIAASAAWRAQVASLCNARDARHAEYDTKLRELLKLAESLGIKTVTISPLNTGFAYYLKKHGVMDRRGVVEVSTKAQRDEFAATMPF